MEISKILNNRENRSAFSSCSAVIPSSSLPSSSMFNPAATLSSLYRTESNPKDTSTIPSTSSLLFSPLLVSSREVLFGKRFTVVSFEGDRWLIGVQISSLLSRETYNLYRSLKIKNVTVKRASPEQLDFMLKNKIVKPGTRSVTFVAYHESIPFIECEIKKFTRKKRSHGSLHKISSESAPLFWDDKTQNALIVLSELAVFELREPTSPTSLSRSPSPTLSSDSPSPPLSPTMNNNTFPSIQYLPHPSNFPSSVLIPTPQRIPRTFELILSS